MSIAFEQGLKFVSDNMGAALGGRITEQWISLDSLINDIAETVFSSKANPAQLQGNVAEVWHGGTLNYSAKIHHNIESAKVLKSTGYGSVDIQVGENKYSSKYYKTGVKSAKAQAKSNREYYMHKKAIAERDGRKYESFDDFLRNRNRNKNDASKSMYDGQNRVIPADQINAAKDYLSRKAQKAISNGNLNEAKRYQDTLKALCSTLKDENGNTSVGLTREDAEKLVKAVRDNKLDKKILKECGLDINQLVTAKDIMSEAFSAGLSAAIISFVIGIAPTIIDGISMLVSEGEIDPKLFAEMGYKGLSSAARGFINGSITAALVACCQSGKLGTPLMGANASMISTAVVLMIGTLESGIRLATGRINKAQMAEEMSRLYITTAFSVGGGIAASVWFVEIPPLAMAAYMLGSFIGGVIGGFAYNIGHSLFMSFCVDSGCTFFGLVDQNYELPQEILDEIGIDVFDYEKFDYETFQYDSFQLDSFTPDAFEYDKFGITIIRRGVIGVGKIGYQY